MNQSLIIQPASMAERNPRAHPVPSGQKGSSKLSPTIAARRGWPFLTVTRAATLAAYRLVKSKMQTSGVPLGPLGSIDHSVWGSFVDFLSVEKSAAFFCIVHQLLFINI